MADCKPGEPTDAPGNRRIIRTARTLETINEAARTGFRPLVTRVQPNKDIHFMVAVFQNPETGEIELSGDFRAHTRGYMSGEMVIDYTLYYPYHFPKPFAAYLFPRDLAEGEEVWLKIRLRILVGCKFERGIKLSLDDPISMFSSRNYHVVRKG